MNFASFMLALVEFPDAKAEWRKSSPLSHDLAVIITTLVVITLVLLVWAVFIRKRARQNRGLYTHPVNLSKTVNGGNSADNHDPHKRRKRRRRRDHRPRNPTLAETGGLPPIRTDGSRPSVL